MKEQNDNNTKVNMSVENDPREGMQYKTNDIDIKYKTNQYSNTSNKHINNGIKQIQQKLYNLTIENNTKLQNNNINEC